MMHCKRLQASILATINGKIYLSLFYPSLASHPGHNVKKKKKSKQTLPDQRGESGTQMASFDAEGKV